jgi:hypothetical protein
MSESQVKVTRRAVHPLLESVIDQIDEVLEQMVADVRRRTDEFWDEYGQDPSDAKLIGWFQPRCWREIDYVFMLGEELRRYGLSFERKHITALGRQLHDEARHYEQVGRIIAGLGGEVPTQPPRSAVEWSAFLWDCLDRHRLGGIAAWYTSESAATGTLEGIVEGGKRYDMPHVARTYEQIIKDESFHLGLGRTLINRYVESEEDVREVLRAVNGMADIVARGSHTTVVLPTG